MSKPKDNQENLPPGLKRDLDLSEGSRAFEILEFIDSTAPLRQSEIVQELAETREEEYQYDRDISWLNYHDYINRANSRHNTLTVTQKGHEEVLQNHGEVRFGTNEYFTLHVLTVVEEPIKTSELANKMPFDSDATSNALTQLYKKRLAGRKKNESQVYDYWIKEVGIEELKKTYKEAEI